MPQLSPHSMLMLMLPLYLTLLFLYLGHHSNALTIHCTKTKTPMKLAKLLYKYL